MQDLQNCRPASRNPLISHSSEASFTDQRFFSFLSFSLSLSVHVLGNPGRSRSTGPRALSFRGEAAFAPYCPLTSQSFAQDGPKRRGPK